MTKGMQFFCFFFWGGGVGGEGGNKVYYGRCAKREYR